MSISIDYRQQLIEEISDLSPQELAKIYRVVMLLKKEFIVSDEARYYTESWVQAERDATEEYQQGELKVYSNVDDMMDDILSEAQDK